MKITLSEPDGPYQATIDTEVMDVTIHEAFIGAQFVTEDGARLSVCMRDDGFEVRHWTDGESGPWIEFKGIPNGDQQ